MHRNQNTLFRDRLQVCHYLFDRALPLIHVTLSARAMPCMAAMRISAAEDQRGFGGVSDGRKLPPYALDSCNEGRLRGCAAHQMFPRRN